VISRLLKKNIESKFGKEKAIILLGPRQVGKTTLLKAILSNREDVFWLNGDEIDVQNIFSTISASRLKTLIGSNNIVVIDEAQRIENIGLKLKLITDQIPEVQLFATGSSSFELANKLNEPLTGRKWEFTLFPVSFKEMVDHHGLLEELRILPHRLVYGYYPDIINHPGEEKERLKVLSDSFLYKDLLRIDQIKKTDGLVRLLQALSWQVGSQVSYHELAKTCSLDSKTVEKYIDLLEQAYVIFRVTSFSRNLRNELKKSKKIYFFDNGIRNALIANFSTFEQRNDMGALWENFLVAERIKYNHYNQLWSNCWFWRTTEQQEVDWIEETDGMIHAYEFKWNPVAKAKIPTSFKNAYPTATTRIIHRDNIDSFLL
jgi:uncharacterized protein